MKMALAAVAISLLGAFQVVDDGSLGVGGSVSSLGGHPPGAFFDDGVRYTRITDGFYVSSGQHSVRLDWAFFQRVFEGGSKDLVFSFRGREFYDQWSEGHTPIHGAVVHINGAPYPISYGQVDDIFDVHVLEGFDMTDVGEFSVSVLTLDAEVWQLEELFSFSAEITLF